jgi:MFS family permease
VIRVSADVLSSAGSWTGFVFLTGRVNERFGRRWTGFWGVAVLCVGAALQAGAVHLSMMIIGRIIAGLGTSLVAAAVPLYLSEISPSKSRGAFGALNQIGIVSG